MRWRWPVIGLWAAWCGSTLVVASAVRRLPVREPPVAIRVIAYPHPALAEWDAAWYDGIASSGYSAEGPESQSSIVFYPLYPLLTRLVASASGLTPAAAYPVWLWRRFGTPFDIGNGVYLLEVGSVALFVILAVALFRRGRSAEGLYVAAALFVICSSGLLASIPRYVLVLFPGFMLLSEWLSRRPVLAAAYAFAGAALQVLFMAGFVHKIFVA